MKYLTLFAATFALGLAAPSYDQSRVPLEVGLEATYRWIHDEIARTQARSGVPDGAKMSIPWW